MKTTLLCFLFLFPLFSFAQDCADFSAEAGGNPLKIIFYTQTAECFTVSDKSGTVNSSPSRRVEFYVKMMPNKFKVVLANGTEMEKKLLANETMASMVFEITYNEKKEEWDIKSRFGQAEETAEAKKKREEEWEAQKKAQADEQARRDKEWNDKIEADKKNQPNYYTDYVEEQKKEEAEKKAEEERKVQEEKKAEEERKAAENAKNTTVKAETNTETNTENTSTETRSSGKTFTPSEGKGTHKARFLYNGRPIANTFITLKTPEGEIIGSGMTDNDGKAELRTNFPDGKVNMDMYGEKENSDWKIEGAMTFVVNTKNAGYTDCDIYPIVKFIAEQMGTDTESLAKSWGIK